MPPREVVLCVRVLSGIELRSTATHSPSASRVPLREVVRLVVVVREVRPPDLVRVAFSLRRLLDEHREGDVGLAGTVPVGERNALAEVVSGLRHLHGLQRLTVPPAGLSAGSVDVAARSPVLGIVELHHRQCLPRAAALLATQVQVLVVDEGLVGHDLVVRVPELHAALRVVARRHAAEYGLNQAIDVKTGLRHRRDRLANVAVRKVVDVDGDADFEWVLGGQGALQCLGSQPSA